MTPSGIAAVTKEMGLSAPVSQAVDEAVRLVLERVGKELGTEAQPAQSGSVQDT